MSKVLREIADFMRAYAAENDLREWTVGLCSICSYPVSYVFSPKAGDGDSDVVLDRGCDCLRSPPPPEQASWGEMAEHLVSLWTIDKNCDAAKFWSRNAAKPNKKAKA